MTAKSYEEATVTIRRINELSALRNFSNFRRNKLRFVCFWIYDIYTIISLCFLALPKQLSSSSENNDDTNIVYTLMAVLFAFGFVLTVTIGLRNSKDILVLQKKIDEVDADFKTVGVKINYRRFYFYVTIFAYIWSLHFFSVCIYCFVTYLKDKPNMSGGRFVAFTVSMFARCIGSFVLYDLMTTVHWLELRFKQTNELLKKFILEDYEIRVVEPNEETTIRLGHNFQNKRRLDKCSSESPTNSLPMHSTENVPEEESQSSKKVQSLQRIRSMHLQLCNVLEMLSQIYNKQLLFFVYIQLIGVIVFLYYLYYLNIDKLFDAITNFNILFVYIIENFISFLKIVITCFKCGSMMKEANKATEITKDSYLNITDPDVDYEINQFSLQILLAHQHRELKSTSLFLNWTFIRQCLAFISTYFVFMIQWTESDQTEQASKNETKLN